jgi:alkyldihydroxyacetonephosphate synthase
MRRRSWWAWGWQDEALPADEVVALGGVLAERFGVDPPAPRHAATLGDLALRPPRLAPPAALAPLCRSDVEARASHTYGKSFRDIARGFAGEFTHPPDVVAYPADEADVARLLEWCADVAAAAVPFGGGSSVVGGVTCDADRVVTLDLSRLDRVVEVDTSSRAARVQGGVFGPDLEAQLRPHGLTLRHYPQSFEHSTVGGWLATRSAGHYATNRTHLDEFVESLRVVTPAGVVESRRLPGSGAGPSPDRLFLGSEGALGVITEAWLRVQERPRWKASAAVRFATFEAGTAAARALAQSDLYPANCRLLDAGEAAGAGAADPNRAGWTRDARESVLIVGFESAFAPVEADLDAALASCADHGGVVPPRHAGAGPDDAAGAWRRSFLAAPYWRDALVALGVVAETFETACTWADFPALHASVTEAVRAALREVCGGGSVTCRFTHVYPDGPAPYFTVLAPGRPDALVAQWDAIKAAASDALLAAGGTITHHHAVGRDHRPWYDRQRPDLFAAALTAAKRTLDPAGILNPGVLIDPP